MKVLFANSPVYRSNNCNAKNKFQQSLIHAVVDQLPSRARTIIYHTAARINPGTERRFGVRAGSRWPWVMVTPPGAPHYPFFMGYAAGQLALKSTFDVDIIDYVARQRFCYTTFFKDINKRRPDVIVLEYTAPTADIDQYLIESLSQMFPDMRIVLAGAGVTPILQKELSDKKINIYAFIEGEYALSIEKAILGKIGQYYKGELIMDLKQVAYPFRAFPESALYFDPTMPTPKPQLQIYGSKGCPFRCTFCSWPQLMYNRNVVLRQPDEIKAEIEDALKCYRYKSIFFDDDTFNLDTKRVSEISKMLAQFSLPWTWMGRLDCSPDWLYDQMIADGCVGMRFGVETFALEPLKAIKKGLERSDFEASLRRICNKYPDIYIHLTMMKNMPQQTQQDHERDMQIIRELRFTTDTSNPRRTFQLSDCEPFPGTELFREVAAGNVQLTQLSPSA